MTGGSKRIDESVSEGVDVTHRADTCRRREDAYPRDLLEPLRHRMLGGHLRELPIDGGDAVIESTNLVDDEPDGVSQQIGERDLRVLENGGYACEDRAALTGL